MKTKNFEVKSLLSIYSLIPTLTEAIDKLVRTRASCSSYENVDDGSSKQMEKIIELMQQKVNLINLKVLADETLVIMKEENAKLIIARYIDNIKIENIAEHFKLSIRGTYRKLKTGLDEFKKIFLIKVCKNKSLWASLMENYFWGDVFNKIDSYENTGSNVRVYPELICSMILRKLRKII